MDKYEFNEKIDQIGNMMDNGNYKMAMQLADTVDWRRVKNVNLLSMVAEIYELNSEYEESKDILLMAYERAPVGKRFLYKLVEIAVKAGDFQEAMDFYREFCEVSPDDSRQYLLRFLILQGKGAGNAQLIGCLEQYLSLELDEAWLYELARLYAADGREEECIKTCDRIMLLFGHGQYVDSAMELKEHFLSRQGGYAGETEDGRQGYSQGGRGTQALAGWEGQAGNAPQQPYEKPQGYPEENEEEEGDIEIYDKNRSQRYLEDMSAQGRDGGQRRTERAGRNDGQDYGKVYRKPERFSEGAGRPVPPMNAPMNSSANAYGGQQYNPYDAVNVPGNPALQGMPEGQAAVYNAQPPMQEMPQQAQSFAQPQPMPQSQMPPQTLPVQSMPQQVPQMPSQGQQVQAMPQTPPVQQMPQGQQIQQPPMQEMPPQAQSFAQPQPMPQSQMPPQTLPVQPMPQPPSEGQQMQAMPQTPQAQQMSQGQQVQAMPQGMQAQQMPQQVPEAPMPRQSLQSPHAVQAPQALRQPEPAQKEAGEAFAGRKRGRRQFHTYHMIIEANNIRSGFLIAKDEIKYFHEKYGLKYKVAKIDAEKLNANGFASFIPKIVGKDLIIENAGMLRYSVVDEIEHYIMNPIDDSSIVLVDVKDRFDRMAEDRPVFVGHFDVVSDVEADGQEEQVLGRDDTGKVPVMGEQDLDGDRDASEGQAVESGTERQTGSRKRAAAASDAEDASWQDLPPDGDNPRDENAGENAEAIPSNRKAPNPSGENLPPDYYEEMDMDDFANYAQEYARHIDCALPGKTVLALYDRIELMKEEGIPLNKQQAEALIEEAADKAEKPGIGKKIGGMFHPQYDKEDRLILREENFMV